MRLLYERVVVPTLTYGADALSMRINERHKLDMELKRSRNECGVICMDRWRNEEVRQTVDASVNMSDKADQGVLKLFGRVDRTSGDR